MKDFKKVEAKWQKEWQKNKDLYRAVDKKRGGKKYVLVEFPYPSGTGLHVGHAFSFTGADIYARFLRMKGANVLFPMGWDAFGLPTENYAIKTKQKPAEVTTKNTVRFKKQMKRLAFSFDWSREVNTTDTDYYRWTQWIFVQLFKKGLAYKKEMPINWCPSCKIGLANEEVVDGKCERCGSEVSKRNISQWIVKITDYADKLLAGLEKTDFVEKVKKAQINWIGRSEGLEEDWQVDGMDFKLKTFTTWPHTTWGATFMVIAPEHPIIDKLVKGTKYEKEVKAFCKRVIRKKMKDHLNVEKSKEGIFVGRYVINPLNGRKMPLYVANFAVYDYGTGIVKCTPTHDQRDFEFAKKYGLDFVLVITPDKNKPLKVEEMEEAYTGEGYMVNARQFDGMPTKEAREAVSEYSIKHGHGRRVVSYHLRDWIFSRQHYWGEPIPMIECSKCGWVPVPEKDLPVKLPEVEAYEPTDTGESPLAKISEFVKCKCPKCGGEARRETDTMPNWAGSDWYFLRYCDPKNDTELASMEKMKYWMPVDVYMGGDEHNTLHLLYSRFIINFLYDIGAVPGPEPYFKRLSHGVILGTDNQRMSKSRENVIVPDSICDRYGVDVVRMYLMFMGPFEGTMAWSEKTLMGVKRFLDRWEKYVRGQMEKRGVKQKDGKSASRVKMKVIINRMVAGVGEDIRRFSFNTAVAKMMEGLNNLGDVPKVKMEGEDLAKMVMVIAPMAPYVAEEMWALLDQDGGRAKSVHAASWPGIEEKYLVDETMVVPVAVNGKKRGEIKVDAKDKDLKEKVVKLARESEKVAKWLEGKKVTREIYVPGKMVNLVVE